MEKWKILVVDDEIEIAEYIGSLAEEIFEDQGDVTVCCSGTRALKIIGEQKPDLIISDIVMPVTDGFKVLEYAAENLPDTEVILLTAHEEFDFIYRANKIRRCSYIVKGEREETIKSRILEVVHEMEKRKKREEIVETAQKQIREVRERYSESKVKQLRSYEEDEADCDQKLLRQLKEYIREEAGANITVAELASRFHYSAAYLSKMFKQYTNENLSVYIMKQKIREAKKMLAETEKSIHVISEELGYQSPQAFARAFRRELDITPQEYRREYGNHGKEGTDHGENM